MQCRPLRARGKSGRCDLPYLTGGIATGEAQKDSEEASIKDLEGLMRSMEKFVSAISGTERIKHLRKAALHSQINSGIIDVVIRQIMKVRKVIFESEGIKDAMREVR